MDASVNRIPSSKDERALLVMIKHPNDSLRRVEYSLDELKMLVLTAGGIIVESLTIKRDKLDASFIIGKGYISVLKERIAREAIKLIVFDLNNLRPAQVRNLEEALQCRVIGRSEVILDIFARRARSSEAKIQVELAQLHYILPRLKGYGDVLSRLGGGIGTRGPGEKMLETDRRHILRRITKLKKELQKYEKHRAVIRKSRNAEARGAVVGYTNAGKSTLVNYLAKDDLFVENRLFATLDAYTRSVYLSRGKKVLLTDTVGFIQNLPTHLIASFKSTLEEIKYAEFIIHVIDIQAPDIETNIETINHELQNLNAADKPAILFFNKTDKASAKQINLITLKYPAAYIGSAVTGEGLDALRKGIQEMCLTTCRSFH